MALLVTLLAGALAAPNAPATTATTVCSDGGKELGFSALEELCSLHGMYHHMPFDVVKNHTTQNTSCCMNMSFWGVRVHFKSFCRTPSQTSLPNTANRGGLLTLHPCAQANSPLECPWTHRMNNSRSVSLGSRICCERKLGTCPETHQSFQISLWLYQVHPVWCPTDYTLHYFEMSRQNTQTGWSR